MTDASSSATPSASPAPAAKPPKRKRTWGQRLKLTAIIVVLLLLAFRVGINVLLPTVLHKVANAYDLDCTYGRIDLSMINGNAHVWDLVLRPKSGGDSIVRADYVQGNISTLNLLRGRLVVFRAEVDGVDMLVDREPDGTIPLLKKFAGFTSPSTTRPPAAPAAAKKSDKPQTIDLSSPLVVEAIRLSHVKTRVRDRSVVPVFDTTIQSTVRVSDVGSHEHPAKFEIDVAADPVLDTLLVSGEVKGTATSVQGTVDVLLRGLHPKPAAGYLTPLGLKPVADNVTVTAKGSFRADVIPNTKDISGNIALTAISAKVDNEEWAALDKLTLDAKKVNLSVIELGTLLIEGGRASARRTPDEKFRIAGMELTPVASTQPAEPTAPMTLPNIRVALGEVRLKNLTAALDDQAISPPTTTAARLDDMTIRNVVYDPADMQQKMTIAVAASVPGTIKTIQLTGSATPFAPQKRVDLKFVADGIKPDGIAPYLANRGLQSELESARFAGDLTASAAFDPAGDLAADVKLDGVKLTDGRQLLAVNDASIDKLTVDPKTGAVKVGSITLSGPSIDIHRKPDGNIAALGLRTQFIALAKAEPKDKTTPLVTARLLPTPPRIEIGKFAWKDVRIAFTDEMEGSQATLAVGDAGVEASDLLFDLQSKSPAKPGKFRAWLAMPKVAERLEIEGTITPAAQSLAIDSTITGSGLTAAAIAPYLKPHGITPQLADGQLKLAAKAKLAQADGNLSASLDLTDVTYRDGEYELAGVDAVRVSEVAIKQSRIDIGEVTIDRPRALLARHKDGAFQAGGVLFTAAAPSTQPAAVAAIPEKPALRLPKLPFEATLKAFHLNDGSLAWTDNAAPAPVNTTVNGFIDLTDLTVGPPDAPPANLKITGRVSGVIDNATVTGTLAAAPEAPAIKLNIVADGIRPGTLAAYLPPGITSTLRGGHFRGSIDAGASNHPDGGIAAHLNVNQIDFNDGADTPLLKLDSLKLAASRIDPDDGAITIDEVSSAGLETLIALNSDGSIDAGGIHLSEPAPAPTDAAQPAAAKEGPAAAPATQPVADVGAIVAGARKPLPLVSLAKLDLQANRVTITGATGDAGAPVSLVNARLRNTAKIEAGGKDAENRPPVVVQATGGVAPVVGEFKVDLRTTPLATTPTLALDLTASNIDGKGLTDLLPQLKPTIDGTPLTQGTFSTHADATVNYGRRGPRDFDLARGFTVDFSVKPVEFRAEPGGPVLAGLEEIRSEGIKVEPASGNVRIKSIEITKPIGRVTRDKDGIHALGLLISEKAIPTTAPTSNISPRAPQLASATEPPPSPASPAVAPKSEIRLDRLTVSGIDFTVEDVTTEPKTLVPLNGLDLDVRDVSNQMPFDGKPMRFSMLMTADKVPLPPRKGAQGKASTQPSDQGSAAEMRELFAQITADGRIALKPVNDGYVLDGWAKTSVNGFELLGVRGLAKQYDVTVGGGVFDDFNDIRFNPSGNIETQNKLVLTNLSLKEPPNGPIQRTLKINVPIDVAIALVTDPDSSITFKLPVKIKNGAISASDIVGPAVGAVAGVVTTAIASAPMKAIGGVTGLMGVTGKKKTGPEPTVTVQFLPGYAALDGTESSAMDLLIKRMQRDNKVELQLRHELSAGDVERASVRANPAAEDAKVLADRLRREKANLIARRAELAGQARGELGARPESEARTTLDALKAVDRQIAQTETALDQLYDLLRPGSERQADRRTRAASLEIGQERLAAVRAALVAAGVSNADQRIRQTNPQFAPSDSETGGQVVVTIVPKKK